MVVFTVARTMISTPAAAPALVLTLHPVALLLSASINTSY
jgi:hypothetical protein